jgi:tRNA A-37 threonylcarbamoyl transferase component Bud32
MIWMKMRHFLVRLLAKKAKVGFSGTQAVLSKGRVKAVGKIQERLDAVDRMSRAELLSYLRKKKQVRQLVERQNLPLEKIHTEILKNVAKNQIARIRQRIAYSSPFFYREMDPGDYARMEMVTERLVREGIKCETIESVSKKKGKLVVKTRNVGRPMAMLRLKQITSEENYKKIAECMGKVHKAGVEHGHPHLGNLVLDKKGRVVIIDFRKAKVVETDWKNPKAIISVFQKDYNVLCDNLGFASSKEPRTFFGTLVSQYPIKPETKKELLELIEDQIIKTRWN